MSINLNRVQNLIEKPAFISCYISENELIRAILIFMLMHFLLLLLNDIPTNSTNKQNFSLFC